MKIHRHLMLTLLLFFTALFALPATANEAPTFNQIVIFGDSLTDNGNLYRAFLGIMPKPPYYQGRFSNGPTWADVADKYFAEKHNITTENYAVGGETVILRNPFEGHLPYAFKNSLDSYYFHTLFKDKSHTLFIIWLGANDYLQGAKNPEEATSAVITMLQKDIDSLIAAGAKNFLILNLPDMAVTPMAATGSMSDNLHQLSLLHNNKLQAAIDATQKQHQDITIRSLNVFGIYEDMIKNLDAYNQKYQTHIKNLTDACWTNGYFIKSMANPESDIRRMLEADYDKKSMGFNSQNKKDVDFSAMAHFVATTPDLMISYDVSKNYAEGKKGCDNPDEYAFWDTVHPTAVVHKIVGTILIDNINQFYHYG